MTRFGTSRSYVCRPAWCLSRQHIVLYLLTAAIVLLAATSTPAQTGQSSVTLTWTAPGDDGVTGTASQYDIRYSTSPINEANWDQAASVANPPSPREAGTMEFFTVTGLQPSTTYYFALKVGDEVPNWSSISNIVSRTTSPDAIPPAPVDDLEAISGMENGEVDLAWTATGDDSLTGTAAGYIIRYSRDYITPANINSADIFTAPPMPGECGSSETSCITDLDPGEWYYFVVQAVDAAGNISNLSNCDSAIAKLEIVAGVDDDDANLPVQFELAQNYPNPFNPSTTIEYSVPEASHVRLSVYNMLGQLTATLVDQPRGAGTYAVEWDGTDDSHTPVATGVYFYRIEAGNFVESKRMVLLK